MKASVTRISDPLGECLCLLVREHGKTLSREQLVAGLPLKDGKLTADLFVRAAERVGFSCRIVQRSLGALSDLLLPAVLLLEEGGGVILRRRKEAGSLEVMWPEAGGGVSEVEGEEIEKRYLGYTLLLQPLPDVDDELGALYVGTGRSTDWFWRTLFAYRRLYAEVLLASLLTNLFVLASPVFTLAVYDRIFPNQAEATLWVLAIGVVAVFAFDLLIKMIRAYFLNVAGKRADVVLASRIFGHILNLRMADTPRSSGSLVYAVREFETLRDFFSSATLCFVLDVPFLFLFLGVLWLLCGKVALVPLLAVPLVIACGFLTQIPMRRMVGAELGESAEKYALLTEVLSRRETVKTLGAEGYMQRLWERSVAQTSRLALRTRFLSSLGTYLSAFVQQSVTVGVMVGGFYLAMAGELTMGGLIAASILSGRALAPLGQVASILSRWQRSRLALARLDELMALPPERNLRREYLSCPRLEGRVGFQRVSFTYPEQKLPALSEVSLEISPGEHVALLGRVGSGKSTLLRLVAGLYQPVEGLVRLDGVDLEQLDPAEVRANLAFLSQDPELFQGTIRSNLQAAARRGLDEDAVRAALEISGLDRLVAGHPRGVDLPVGEGGSWLSGGQRQLVAITRSLLLDAPVFLMDEPTASLDANTELHILRNLQGYLKGRTLLLATHKVPLLQLVDRIVILDEGRVVADGPRDEVLASLQQSPDKAASGVVRKGAA